MLSQIVKDQFCTKKAVIDISFIRTIINYFSLILFQMKTIMGGHFWGHTAWLLTYKLYGTVMTWQFYVFNGEPIWPDFFLDFGGPAAVWFEVRYFRVTRLGVLVSWILVWCETKIPDTTVAETLFQDWPLWYENSWLGRQLIIDKCSLCFIRF